MKKQILFKTKGMNRDLSVSAFNSQFSYENMNLRLSTNEGNTMMSWVNEKGPKRLTLSISSYDYVNTYNYIKGIVIGTAVTNDQLVIFSTESPSTTTNTPDHIYVLKYSGGAMQGTEIYSGKLNFSVNKPLETLVSYESSNVQKVYWTDNRNQPRVINIKATDKFRLWNSSNGTKVDTFFDFSPAVNLTGIGRLTVRKNPLGGGMFSPGVIQYCYTYYNKYGQQSNIIDVSPLYYLSYSDRGASPEDKVSSSFTITIDNPDTNFDYVRLYSIQRTSVNSTPMVRFLEDISIKSDNYAPGKHFTKNYEYSNDSNLILPMSINGRIKSLSVENGSYHVSVSNVLLSFKNTTNNVQIVALASTSGKAVGNIMSFQELIDYFYHTTDDRENATYAVRDYYFDLFIDQEQSEYISHQAEIVAGETKWGLSVDGTVYTGTTETGFYLTDFVYNYQDETWYIVNNNSGVNVSVTKNETPAKGTVNSVTFTDNGTKGSNIDPTEMLYIGGRDICAYTMADKDNTLFLGNIKENVPKIPMRMSGVDISFNRGKVLSLDHTYGVYANTHQLEKYNQQEMTTLKGGEWYRFGMQLQMANGQWSSPIYLGDKKNTLYPGTFTTISGADNINLATAEASINLSKLGVDLSKVKRVRPLIVFPSAGSRSVVCQGVLNPTVFNAEDRVTNSPYAQASWYFRPYMVKDIGNGQRVNIDDTIVVNSSLVTKATTPEVLPVDSNFEGKTENVYAIFVKGPIRSFGGGGISKTITKNTETTTTVYNKRTNEVVGKPDTNITTETLECDGIIIANNTYIFISKENKWIPPGKTTTVTQEEKDFYVTSEVTISYSVKAYYSEGPFKMYSGLTILDSSNRYVYKKNSESDPDEYKFWLMDNTYVYMITFKALSDDYYDISTKSGKGKGLNFSHFDSIYSQEQAEKDVKDKGSKEFYKCPEIQGSVNTYESVTDDYVENAKSNTQFFVDQSIVTLNSPDIEFDTEVQNCATNNLKLRIVGAIPITSNASAHHITYKNSMLEEEHGSNPKDAIFGTGESHDNIIYTANPINVNAGNRLIADYLWNDTKVTIDASNTSAVKYKTDKATYNYMIYPWHRTGSLNTDSRKADEASSYLNTKKESTLLYSISSVYLTEGFKSYNSIGVQMALTENSEVMNIRLPKQSTKAPDINYYPNIDKVLVNGNGYKIICYNTNDKEKAIVDTNKVTSPISMKYKSTSHAVIDLLEDNGNIPTIPYGIYMTNNGTVFVAPDNVTNYSKDFFWGPKENYSTSNLFIPNILNYHKFNYLWLGELYRDIDADTIFGGTSDSALMSSNWVVGGDSVDVTDNNITLDWTIGDTYFQRYDCLKTYPFTNEDPNQITEILSFMCETRVNIDGRYDRNRGQIDNTMMSPVNFNLFNPVYSQKDNFFNYKMVDEKDDSKKYSNLITYTNTKTAGANVDEYTHITLASVLDMDGDKGTVNAIRRFNNNLLTFQDTGIAQLLYNENVQISTQSGVPVEIANSGKVQGKRYLSDTIGCSDKYTIVSTPSGLYFMDNYDKSIFLFNGQLKNISTEQGFNAWCKKNIPNKNEWNPRNFDNFVAYYDKKNQDVLFINRDIALAYSEKFNTFTSFYDYGNTSYFVNLEDKGILVNSNSSNLWLHNGGEYCNFFGQYRPYWMTLVGNPDPQQDKIFTNLEFRASVTQDGEVSGNKFTPYLPFDTLEAWDEYQHGVSQLSNLTGHQSMVHSWIDSKESLKRKYRIWRCDIPRDNAKLSSDEGLNIFRTEVRPLHRLRNPWVYLKLEKYNDTNKKVEIHDVGMEYFV